MKHPTHPLPALLVSSVLCLTLVAAPGATFHVALDGSDRWSGKFANANAARTDGPFASFERAQQAVRESKGKGVGSVTILIKGGTYHRVRTLHLTLADGAGPGQTITWAAAPGAAPVLSAGIPLSNWKMQDPPGVPAIAKGKVYAASVAHVLAARKAAALPHGEGLALDPVFQDRIMTLWGKAGALPRARGKGFRTLEEAKSIHGKEQMLMRLPPGAGEAPANPAGADLLIIPTHYWIMNVLPIVSLDRAAGTIATGLAGTYALARNHMDDRDSVWIENAPEDVDEPGEWCYDAATRSVFLFSPAGPPDYVVAPVLTELVRIEGEIKYAEARDVAVQGITLRGLTYTHGERIVFGGGTGWGLQHDWEMFDRPSALVRLRGAERCAVEDCLFTESGHAGVRLDLHCISNRLVGNELRNLGGTGILLAGYGPGTKDVNRDNDVRNNYIHHTGRQYWGAPALFLWQSGGNTVANNHIHHVPYAGIVVSGRIIFSEGTNFPRAECSRTVRWGEVKPFLGTNWKVAVRSWWNKEPLLHGRGNRIERNEIHNIMEALGDGNAIYISGTGGGNLVRENHIHDCSGRYMNAVIRNDDDQHGSTFDGNLIARSGGWGEAFINKGSNHMRHNVVADLRGHESHRAYLVLNTASQAGSTLEHNVFYATMKGHALLSEEGTHTRNKTGSTLRQFSTVDRNLYWCTEDPRWAEEHFAKQRPHGIELGSRAADPQFEESSLERTFRFKPGSPALALGIRQPFDLKLAGLEEPWRGRRVGETLRTRVTPDRDTVLWKPAEVTLASSDPKATIRYTLDGQEPTQRSTRYEGPLRVSSPCTLKAKSFADGKQDLVGAVVSFSEVPGVADDFENAAVGAKASLGQTVEDGALTARASEERSASGKRSLKFIDGPGGKYEFTPHLFYKVNYQSGLATISFDLCLDGAAKMDVAWRDYTGGQFATGPDVSFGPDGRVSRGAREFLRLPERTWVSVEMSALIGEKGDGTWELALTPAGAARKTFPGLPYPAGFKALEWVGFISLSEEKSEAWLDNVRIRAVEKRQE
jgi:hypothetical protein